MQQTLQNKQSMKKTGTHAATQQRNSIIDKVEFHDPIIIYQQTQGQ